MKTTLALLLSGALVAAAGCNASTKKTASERSCATTSAISQARFKGAGMPMKTIALTFDDGPGPRTDELSHYLKSQNIRAAFFVNGKMLTHGEAILRELVADGHVIANHTQSHPDLTSIDPATVINEVSQTDALIANFVPDQRFMFRPPFGKFDDNTFAALEGSAMSKYVGPIDWDIGDGMSAASAADWDCWSKEGNSDPPVLDVQTCGDLYVAEIKQKSNGIVLMHDPYFIDDDPSKGGTVDMVKYIVPILQAEGFQFMRLDEVPSIAAALPPLTSPSTSSGENPPPSSEASSDSTEPCPPSPQQ